MKKIVLTCLILASVIKVNSQDEPDMTLKENNAKMSFYANSILPEDGDPSIVNVGIRLWMKGKSCKYRFCCKFGICGDQSIVIQTGNNDFQVEGRQVIWRVNSTLLGSANDVTIYLREDVSTLSASELEFSVFEDSRIIENFYFKAGDYAYDPSIGEFGGYKINIIQK